MFKSFNHFIKTGLLVSFSLLLVSILLITTYARQNDINLRELGKPSLNYLHYDSDYSVDLDQWIYKDVDYSSDYKTRTLIEENNFDVIPNITIDSSLESIAFVHEDRNDIKIIFYKDIPDSNSMLINYSASQIDDDTLYIEVKNNLGNLLLDQDYKGLLEIHVPKAYHCEKLTLQNGLIKLTDASLPASLDRLILISDIASLDLTINQPIDAIKLTMDVGKVSMNINAKIDAFLLDCDSADLDLNIQKAPNDLTLRADAGSIHINYKDHLNPLSIKSSFADIDINVLESETGLIYTNSTISNIDSDLEITDDPSKALIKLGVDVASITVNAIY